MKKLVFTVLLCAALGGFLAAPAGAIIIPVDAVTTTFFSEPVSITLADRISVQVRSASGSSAVITIETSLDLDEWTPVATITDPDAKGEIYLGPGMAGGFLRISVAYASGTITVKAAAAKANGEPIF